MKNAIVNVPRLILFERTVRVAHLLKNDGTGAELRELIDAEVIWLDGKVIRVRGVEMLDGTLFGQTWDIKVVK